MIGSTPEEFSRYIRSESARWADVIRKTGIKADGQHTITESARPTSG